MQVLEAKLTRAYQLMVSRGTQYRTSSLTVPYWAVFCSAIRNRRDAHVVMQYYLYYVRVQGTINQLRNPVR